MSVKSPVIIEVCVDSVESALAALRGGADRLEICANLGLGGGTTPSSGLVKMIRDACPPNFPLMSMVRPRTGDFLYSDLEMTVMLADIEHFKELGVAGVVIGALCSDGTIDIEKTQTLAQAACDAGLQVCFHRAIDMVLGHLKALESLLRVNGITRLLVSGSVPGSQDLPMRITRLRWIAQSVSTYMHATSKSAFTVMPGSGINAGNSGMLLENLFPFGVREVHLSGGKWVDNGMHHRVEGMGMGVGGEGEWGVWRTSEEAIRGVREAVDKAWEEYEESKSSELQGSSSM